MDEAEQLCDRIAIMINGQFVRYGSPGELKTMHNQGYAITIAYPRAIAPDSVQHTPVESQPTTTFANFKNSNLIEISRSETEGKQTVRYHLKD